MTTQFGREAILTFTTIGATSGKKIVGLRVAFNVEKSVDGGSNTAKIQVWNLAELTRNLLGEKDAYVILEAGYSGDVKILASGEVKEFRHTKQGPDRVTEITLADGFSDLVKAKFSKSYMAGSPVLTVLQDLVQKFTNAKKSGATFDFVDLGKQLFTGGTFTGQAKTILDSMLKPFNAKAYIEHNELIIVTENESLQTLEYQLTATTGLVGSPTKKTVDTKSGVELSVLLNPNILLRHLIKVSADTGKGEYIVEKISHIGDTHRDSWLTRIEAMEKKPTVALPKRGGKAPL